MKDAVITYKRQQGFTKSYSVLSESPLVHYFYQHTRVVVHWPALPALVGLWGPPLEPRFLCREVCGGDSIPLSLREAVAAARAWLPRVPPGWYMALGLETGTATCMEKFCWGNAVGYKGETNRQIFTHKHTQHPRSDGSVVVMASLTERNPWGLALINKYIYKIIRQRTLQKHLDTLPDTEYLKTHFCLTSYGYWVMQ